MTIQKQPEPLTLGTCFGISGMFGLLTGELMLVAVLFCKLTHPSTTNLAEGLLFTLIWGGGWALVSLVKILLCWLLLKITWLRPTQ